MPDKVKCEVYVTQCGDIKLKAFRDGFDYGRHYTIAEYLDDFGGTKYEVSVAHSTIKVELVSDCHATVAKAIEAIIEREVS